MTETGAWAGSWTRTASVRPDGLSTRRPGAAGLWALLRAQSLLAGRPDAFALAEDDRHRRATGHIGAPEGLIPR